MAHTCIRKKY